MEHDKWRYYDNTAWLMLYYENISDDSAIGSENAHSCKLINKDDEFCKKNKNTSITEKFLL